SVNLYLLLVVVGVAIFFLFFFFQAEDGIRDLTVTGVQTCALPISGAAIAAGCLILTGIAGAIWYFASRDSDDPPPRKPEAAAPRTEERRVGKECRSRGAEYA